MTQLIESDPAEALRRSIPVSARSALPKDVAGELETVVRGVGTLAVVCALPAEAGKPAEIQREVIVDGRHYRAFTHGRRLEQTCAERTPVFGVAVGDVLALDETPYRRLDRDAARSALLAAGGMAVDPQTGADVAAADVAGALDEGDRIAYFGSDGSLSDYLSENWEPYMAEFGGTAGGPGTTNSWTQGTRKFVAYRARFAEDATNYEPYAYASGVSSFNTVSNWYYEWSYGSCTMQFVVVTNVYVFTNSGAWYEANGGWPKVLADCRTVSTNTPESYTNFNFDSVTHNWNVGLSGYAGVAYVGGRGASFHEGYGANDGVIGHEHGHNLGLPHNNFWDTGGMSIIGPGTHSEYGNDYDIMGNGYADWPFAANMRNRLSWLPDMHAHYNVTAGTHRVYAFDSHPPFLPDTNAPLKYALAMPKDGRNYVFEFRQDTNRIGGNQSFLNGVLLEVDSGFGGGPELLDCTPGSAGGKSDAPLTIGRMFTDPGVNLHVTPVARGTTSRTNWIDLVVNRNTQLSNHPPAQAITASAYTTTVGTAITLTSTAADPDGDDLAYYWEFGDGGVSYNNTNVQVKSWSTAGVYAVRCVVADMHGREAAGQINVTVGSPGAKFLVGGRVTTPAGGPVADVRIVSGAGTVYSDVDGRFLIPNLSAGSYTFTAYGADDYGNNFTFTYNFANPVTVGPDQADLSIIAATVTGTNVGSGTGFLYERWDGIAGTAVSALTGDARYPNNPDDQRVMVGYFEAPTDRGDNYGTRMRAFFTAPQTGAYTFYIASDDNSELWFSTTTNPASATRIATVPNYTAARTWNTYTNQKSAAISLAAGQKCYIEALQKEGSGGDNLAVGVDLPDGSQERPIPFHRLDPWPLAGAPPLTYVSITAADATASEPGADTGAFVFVRSGDLSADQTVAFQLTGSATYDIDYLPTGVSAFFAAGETQVVVTVTPRDDALSEAVETVVATLLPGADYGVTGNPTATVVIVDNEATAVTVSSPDSAAAEGGNAGTFLITRTGVSTGTITVGLSVGGTASNGVDYAALPASAVIPAGSSTVSFVVSPVADGVTELAETVTLTALAGSGYVVGNPSNATVTIAADSGPGTGILREWWNGIGSGSTVADLTSNPNYPATPSGSAILTNLFETPVNFGDSYGQRCRGYFIAPVNGSYYFYISSDDASDLLLGTNTDAATATRIAYVSAWTASRVWTTYASQKSAAIPLVAGQQVYIEALHKEGGGGDNLAVGVEYPGGYQELPAPYHRFIPFDTQKPTVSIVANDPAASEAGDTGSVLVARSSEGAASSLPVALSIGGTAAAGADYTALATQVVFAAGVTNVWLKIAPIDDATPEGPETVSVAIVDNASRFFTSGSASQAVVTIADDDVPAVSVAASKAYAYEAGPTSSAFVISRSGPTGNAVTITYTLSGAATPGSDFAPLPGYITTNGTVTLAAGQVATNLEIVPVNDASAEGAEGVTLTLSSDPLYLLGTPVSDTITILDDDVAPVIALNSPSAASINIPSGVGLLLDATVTHNGLPNPPSVVTQIWTQTSGPTGSVATLTTSNDWKSAAATFPTSGTFVLTLTAVAGVQTRATSVTVNVGAVAGASWATGSIGFVSPVAMISVANGTNTIVSSGRPGLVGGTTTDNFSYVMMPVAGNCSITARVVSVQNIAGTNSFGGVIMRESLTTDSKYAAIGLQTGTSVRARFSARSTNAVTSRSRSPNATLAFPYWVRLVRAGNTFSSYYSSAGSTWTLVGVTNIAMSNTIHVGVGASSGSNGVAGTAVFDRIGIVSTTLVGNVGALVSAGGSTGASLPNPATLAGSASDDGLPSPPGALTFAWTKVSGPGAVSFANPTSTSTTASFESPGAYMLRLIANDGQIRTFGDVLVQATGVSVRIAATDAFAASPGTNTGTFTITRTGDTNAALAVNLGVSGSAVGGVDYMSLATQVVIAAGASNATLTVSPIDFSEPRDTVSVVVAVSPSAAYAVEAPGGATVTIANTNLPRITVVASDPFASEPPGLSDTGTFLFNRLGGTNYALTVACAVAGTATAGVDYVALPGSVTFPAGVSNVAVTVTPIDHAYGQLALSVVATVVATGSDYAAGVPDNATVTITNRNFLGLNLVWNGTTNNVWDLAATPNWAAPEIGLLATVFSNNYGVTFDDTPGVQTNVALPAGTLLSPAQMLVDASSNAFSLTGAAGLAGTGTLVKAGTARFVLATTSNTFSGVVIVSNGVLVTGVSNALGSTAGATVVSGAGTLDVNGQNLGGERVSIAGTGFAGQGAIINTTTQQTQAIQYLALDGDASIGGSVRWDVRAGTSPYVNLNGFTLTKTGTNYVALVSTAVTNAGSIVVNQGTLAFSVNTPVSGPGTTTINAGGTLAPGNFGGSPATLKPIVMNGGTLLEDNGSGGVTVGAPITLNAGAFTNAFNAPDNSLVVSNVVSGPGALTKTGANNLFLTAASTYAGGTLVSAGALFLGNNTAAGSVPGTITNNANVYVYRSDYAVFTNAITGAGSLNIRNTASLEAGGLVACSNLYVGQSVAGQLNIQSGATAQVMALFLGNPSSYGGTVVQSGGVVNVWGGDSSFRIGHWPSETSVYTLSGGGVTCSNTTISVGWDGTGFLNVAGGSLLAQGLNIPRTGHAGPGTFNLSGGTVRLGTGGLTLGGGTATINLGGGTLGAYASWSSTMPMNLTGSNGLCVVDTATNTINLSGALSGTGGLVKAGAGTLAIAGLHGFGGGLVISNGVLQLNGVLLTSGVSVVSPGTLGGTGRVAGAVANGGLVSPALTGVGTLVFSNSYVQAAAGTLLIQLQTSAVNDRIAVTGAAALDGALVVTNIGTFVPAVGNAFTVLTASTVSGRFAATNLPALPVHRAWNVAYATDAVVVAVVFTNAAPSLSVPGPHVLALGSATNFTVSATDPDGDATTITNTVRPAGATFTSPTFAWTPGLAAWNSTQSVVFVATDAYGQAVTNATTIAVPYDADGDGLPDNWEWTYFASLTNGPASSPAGKGPLVNDFIAGTDPTNLASVFRAVAISNTPSLVSVATVSGRIYRVWFTDGALEGAPVWQLFGNQANGFGTWTETNAGTPSHVFLDDFSTNASGFLPAGGVRFYRLDVRLAP